MANLNKVMLIGRLTRDPEVRTFSNGGRVAKFGFAVNNRKKNQQTGEWEDEPVWLDVEAFDREQGRKLAELVERSLRKGHQVYLEGALKLDNWTDKDGQQRSKLKIVLTDLQFLEPREGGGMRGGSGGGGEEYEDSPPPVRSAPRSAPPSAPARSGQGMGSSNGGGRRPAPPPARHVDEDMDGGHYPQPGGGDDDIPF